MFEPWRTWIQPWYLCSRMVTYCRGTSSCRLFGRLHGEPFLAAQHCRQNGEVGPRAVRPPEDMVGQILDIVEVAPAATPYTSGGPACWRRIPCPPMRCGACSRRWSSWADAGHPSCWRTCMEFCPACLEQSLSCSTTSSIRGYPQALRTQLGEVQPGNPRALAARAGSIGSIFFRPPGSGSGSLIICKDLDPAPELDPYIKKQNKFRETLVSAI